MHSDNEFHSHGKAPLSARLRGLAASTALSTLALTSLVGAPASAQQAPASITIVSPSNGALVDSRGDTIVGKVAGSLANVKLTAQVGSDASTLRTLEVNQTSGEFAYRLFQDDMKDNAPVTVTLTLTRGAQTETDPVTFATAPSTAKRGLAIAGNRLSFGWTAQLQHQINDLGFAGWVKAQLNPVRMVPETKLGHEPWLTYENTVQFGGFVNADGAVVMTQNSFAQNSVKHRLFTAAYTDRQLNEKLALFWASHFWDILNDKTAHYPIYRMHEIEKYRQHALGSFRDLLTVSSENPLMMAFLSNWQNTAKSHNENFGREVLELHTVGTKAGYGDDDVTAASRVFTGWTLVQSNDPNVQMWHDSGVVGLTDPSHVQNEFVFKFDPTLHDTGDKTFGPFLNNLVIKGQSGDNGISEGRQLLDALANSDWTKKHVCSELVQMLVADDPPQGSIDRCVKAWGTTGIVAHLVQAIVLDDPHYLETVQSSTKVKTPFEFAISLMRNLSMAPNWSGTGTSMLYYLNSRVIDQGGEDLSGFDLPIGFGETATDWLGQSLLINRFNASNITEDSRMTSLDWMNLPGISHTIPAAANVAATWAPDAATKEEAAAALLGFATGDNYTRAEFDGIAAAFAGSKGFVYATDFQSRVKKAARLLLMLPSYQLK